METSFKEYKTIDEIRQDFVNKLLSAKEAVDLLAKKETKKTWHTKAWREKRKKLIKGKCEQCTTTEPPMVLQHTWHPEKLTSIIREVSDGYRAEFAKTNPFPNTHMPIPESKRQGCPGCGKFSGFNWRKTTSDWRCVHCRTVFDELVDIPTLSSRQEEEYYGRFKYEMSIWEARFMEQKESDILGEALRIGFEQHDRYISCVDTVTFCKKCAFMWDKNDRKICKGCKEWTPIYTTPDSCWTCLDKIYGFEPNY